MLRHYTLTTPFPGLDGLPWIDESRVVHRPMFDIAPGREAPIVYKKRRGTLILASARWGLVPSWADRSSVGNRLPTVGIEEADSEPAFQSAFRVRRCLLPADGFFKWQDGDDGTSRLFWFHRPDRAVFAVAGVWEEWISRETRESVRTFAMVTITPRARDRAVDDRWPAILEGDAWKTWMNSRVTTEELARLPTSPDRSEFEARPVSPEALMRGDGGPETIQPV